MVNIADVQADFGSDYSLDTTLAGATAAYNISYGDGSGSGTFCRDHFKQANLYWDGGNGLMHFQLDPPLLFRRYRSGNYTSPRGLLFRNAVYETIQPAEATDPAGSVWRFQGQFNAKCLGGEYEIGPIVYRGQLLVPENPLNPPVLIRTACGDGPGGVVATNQTPATVSPSLRAADCTPAEGGGGGRISMQRCTTTQVDYYWYYPDTGQFEYRYSETTTSCVAMD